MHIRGVGIAAAATALVLVTVFLAVFTDDGDHAETTCVPTGPPSAVTEGVPAGQLSKPMLQSDRKLTSGFRTPDRPNHLGLDFAGPVGAPIFAIADGVVAAVGEASGFGYWIVLDHQLDGAPVSTVYGHMFGSDLTVGQQIKAGQHIANEGYNGEVDPPDSRGAHLHVEVWPGGRFTGGSPTDPTPYIDRGAEPGTTDNSSLPSPPPTTSTPSAPAPSIPSAPPTGSPNTELASLPAEVGSEDHLQVDAIRVARAVHARFPGITHIGGYRPDDPFPDHPSGRAVDVMIPDPTSDTGRALGDAVRDYLFANRDQFHITYLIWRQQYIPADGAPQMMEDRGTLTANHHDHVHVSVAGGGTPTPDQNYGQIPSTGTVTAPGAARTDCLRSGDKLGDDSGADLLAVPEEFRRWLVISARQCRELTPELLAAQLKQESGFQAGLTSPAGAAGYSQFLPETWSAFGYPVDDNGNRIGAAGTGDPNRIGDAVMAQGAYNCYLADLLRPDIASGRVTGDPVTLMLAAYNAGPGNVQTYGGVPPFGETQQYVTNIQSMAKGMKGVAQ